jgi:hypothetical protein
MYRQGKDIRKKETSNFQASKFVAFVFVPSAFGEKFTTSEF